LHSYSSGDYHPAPCLVCRASPEPNSSEHCSIWVGPSPSKRGSHVHLRHPARGGRVTIPVHAGKVLGPGLTQAILKQTGVDAAELRRVL